MAANFKLFKKKDNKKTDGQNFSLSDKSKFAIVEAYKAARTNIMFSLSAKEKKCFAVTSYSKGEGKSTVSANLAISFSKMEKKVLLIDCDLRRPNIHNIFKLDNKNGLTNVIGKMVDIDEAIKHDVLPNLDILSAGTIAPNPSELMCSTRFYEDMIAGFVVVVRERSTTHGDLQHLLDSVKLADSTVLGMLEVGCTYDSKRRKKGYYYYQYY